LKKIFKIVALVLLLILGFAISYIYIAGPRFPSQVNKRIESVLKLELEQLKGETAFAKTGECTIWYEVLSPKSTIKGDILLIMGIANDALAWPSYFLKALLDNGYRIIRFDNRGTGMTDWVEDWNKANPYDLEDMASDGIAILDTLGIDSAHVFGVSLGGMIAQSMAIEYPDRVQTLISVMSSADIMDDQLPSMNMGIIHKLLLAYLKYGLFPSEKSQIKFQIASRNLLMGNESCDLDIEDISQTVLYNLRERNGFNTKASEQHIAATIKSGSRLTALQGLKIPSLIIHGKSDPLIPFQHGQKCATIIPGADSLWLDGMGHDIPLIYLDEIITAMLETMES
jgi:proline iminopeptidase